MKSSLELKKCEQTLKTVCKAIILKEGAKADFEKICSQRKSEMVAVHSLIRKSNNARNEIKEELNNIRTKVEKKHDEMNRIKADLLYKTKREYEEMIRRLENEMQFNHRSFSSREEARILHEIKSLKLGITLLDSYEEKKRLYDEYKAKLTAKKNEQDQIWSEAAENKMKYHTMNEELKNKIKEISVINGELEVLTNQKLDLKKQIEDLSREQVAKQQQLKRQSLEKLKMDKQLKKDQLILSYEETLREYNKLITYFHKLIYGRDDDSDSKLNTSQTFISNSFSTGCGGYQSCSESSSLASSTNSVQFSQSNILANLKNELSLGLSKVTNNNLTYPPSGNPYSFKFTEVLSPLRSPCLSTDSSLNTPMNDDPPPFFCGNGKAYLKKKFDETSGFQAGGRKNRRGKKNNKNAKISHSVEVINLLSKLQIPIQLSSQLEECLKELRMRKENLINEMNQYKTSVEAEQELKKRVLQQSESSPGNLNNSSINSSNIFSDTNSDISSCLDSNYESDNNSVRSYQSNFLMHGHHKRDSLGLIPSGNILEPKSDDLKESLDKLGNQIVTASHSHAPTNSDDSDVTINESSLNEKELKILSAQLKKNQINTNTDDPVITSSTNSATKSPDIQPNILVRAKSTVGANFASKDAQKIEIKNNFSFFRQISDGYCSSCTPLSARSISNEQPQVNPFFNTTSSIAAHVTPVATQASDPIEAAFLNTNNLNK